MDCTLTADGETLRVSLTGQLIYSDTDPFADLLEKFRQMRLSNCVVDLHRLEHIDSSGLRMLLLTYDVCRENGAELSILGAHGQVAEMLRHSRFDTIVTLVV